MKIFYLERIKIFTRHLFRLDNILNTGFQFRMGCSSGFADLVFFLIWSLILDNVRVPGKILGIGTRVVRSAGHSRQTRPQYISIYLNVSLWTPFYLYLFYLDCPRLSWLNALLLVSCDWRGRLPESIRLSIFFFVTHKSLVWQGSYLHTTLHTLHILRKLRI